LPDRAEVWQITPRPYLSQKESQACVLFQEIKHTEQDQMRTALPTLNTENNAFTPLARYGDGAAQWNRLKLSEVRRGGFLAETRKCVGRLGELSLKCVERAQWSSL
jgi:hypothetical protein